MTVRELISQLLNQPLEREVGFQSGDRQIKVTQVTEDSVRGATFEQSVGASAQWASGQSSDTNRIVVIR